MRIFLDANILFSAAKSDGAIRELLMLLAQAGHECWANAYVVEEARRNLSLNAPARLSTLQQLLSSLAVATTTPPAGRRTSTSSLLLPEKDRPVLEAAIALHCAALVTGDRRHFGALYGRTVDGVTIHSPRTLADALLA